MGSYLRVDLRHPANSILILGADHVFSMTYTLELRPLGDGFSLRLEYRYDRSYTKSGSRLGAWVGRRAGRFAHESSASVAQC